MAGIYGAIAVGFFAAVFGGTRPQISGPTAPIAMAMAVVVATHADNLAQAFTVVIMAGLIQALLGAIRVGRFVAYAPFSVISGLLSGVGIIIILVQTLPFVGAPVAIGGPVETVRAWLDARHDVNYSALAIGVVTLAVVVAWPKRLRTYLPPTLVALLAGTLLSALWLSDTPVVGDVPTGLPELQLPDVSVDALAGAVLPALIIALLGAIDSLLTSRVADSMTRTRHDQNRELIGQGIGNMAVGFIGGLPGAGVTPGTVANLRAGGRTPVSGALRAAILLALVLGLGAIRRVHPPRGAGRNSDQDRLGHHRLAVPHPHPPRAARAPAGHGRHTGIDAGSRPGHRRGHRTDCRRRGKRAPVRAP